jgi:SAM-dependent methyltransferase
MSGFSAEWLALREPFDLRARNLQVLDAVGALLGSHPSVRIADFACGTGSTVRALHARLPARQHWDLVDNDPRLLAIARHAVPAGTIELNAIQLDLSKDVETILQTSVDLVTMSALLDLVSEAWLRGFLHAVAARTLPVYAALTYDGRIDLSPADPFDTAIISAFNAHQGTDKGFGAALGPAAARATIAAFEAPGYKVVCGNSDWSIAPDDRTMQIELLGGWAGAAGDIKTLADADIAGWLARRTRLVSDGHSSMRVGHVDLLALPSATR